ncbi:MAG: hypothetical protein KDD45_08080 [Bdellovibrionales bacterium]|nr:hypothetical protein [Bdellovibrionales bacterium]
MIDILLFSIIVVAEKIESTDNKYEVIFYKQLECILELKTKDLIVVNEVKTTKLIT